MGIWNAPGSKTIVPQRGVWTKLVALGCWEVWGDPCREKLLGARRAFLAALASLWRRQDVFLVVLEA